MADELMIVGPMLDFHLPHKAAISFIAVRLRSSWNLHRNPSWMNVLTLIEKINQPAQAAAPPFDAAMLRECTLHNRLDDLLREVGIK